MRTFAGALADDARKIQDDIQLLIGKHSNLRRHISQGRVVFIGPNNYWSPLSVDARRLQTKALSDYRKYSELISILIRVLPAESLREFKVADKFIVEHIEQSNATYCKTPEEVVKRITEYFASFADMIDSLHSTEGLYLMIPDTNAFIANPEFSKWQFDECASFEMILTPTVLAELDELKISHRVPEVRTKAESVIRRIKELGRRGDPHTGILVVRDRITAKSVAVEPKMTESLPWLDATNNDDRFLASVIEIIRENVRSAVSIVTGDVNLQNKARFARIPFCEPPSVPVEVGQ